MECDMGIRELREKYGATKARQAINRAIRAELPGGPEILDLIDHLQTCDPSPATDRAHKLALQAQAAMSAEIARRYDLRSTRE